MDVTQRDATRQDSIKEPAMSNDPQSNEEGTTTAAAADTVEFRLEVVVLPVTDVDRAKRFYGGLGWRLDADFANGDDLRVVQLTPPGSPCSVIFGKNVTAGARGLDVANDQHQVADRPRRAQLIGCGADVSPVFHDAGGVFHHAGTNARVPGPDPQGRSYCSWASFSDPDGNGWLLQEITARLPGRV
jgi:catechol 2,3-dioxygenase-like lactoylglutathione lyase family enzyme